MSFINTAQGSSADQLQACLQNLTVKIINVPILHDIREGRLSRDEWVDFARQRYLAALSFEPMLTSGIAKAEEEGDEEVTRVLMSNLRDERGIDSYGHHQVNASHERWRRDFYRALGIKDEELLEAESLPGTSLYTDRIRALSEHGNHLDIAGGILMQEYSLPFEFRWLQKGRDRTFPERFLEEKDDSNHVRRLKRRARLYLDHHIAHDHLKHYPELQAALEKYLDNPEERARIFNGMWIVSEARLKFFESFGKAAKWNEEV